MSGWRIAPLIRAGFVAAMATAATLAGPDMARADAECGITDSGIPDGAVAPIDAAHARKSLADAGIGLGGFYAGEAFANTGGLKQGGKYDGVLELHLDGDLHKMGLWQGLCFHANAFQIHGNSISDNIGALMPVSFLEATDATRLDEIWLEQHMFNRQMSVKLGQLAADTEFLLTDGAPFFLNATLGWPALAAADMPGGGPAYPLATPGVRVAVKPNDNLRLMVGVYNGNPADPNCTNDNPQICNSDGLDFRLELAATFAGRGDLQI